jgi:hypothetical protein
MSAQVIGRIRWATCDAMPVALALAHGLLLLGCPSVPLIALGIWWSANTLSHQFIHRPFFRTRLLNTIFSCYLSLLLGVPQSLWRARHLAHHRELEGRAGRTDWKLSPLDLVAVVGLWSAMLFFSPEFLFGLYLPGFLIGLGLCYLQGYYEHSRGTVSHYGRLYNFLFFNDGYHVEHHARPSANWRELPKHRTALTNESRWPPVLRWLEIFNLCLLERAVLRSLWLQRFVLQCHERAFRRLQLPKASRIAIVGGGLFPRTAMILSRLMPESTLILIDEDAGNLEIARTFLSRQKSLEGSLGATDRVLSADLRSDTKSLQAALPNHQFINERFLPAEPCDVDLLVVPLAFNGTREEIYRHPPAKAVLVHDWIWRQRGSSAVISFLLLKRLNLVTR